MANPLSGGTGDAYSWTYGPSGALTSEVTPTGSAGTNHLATTYAYDPLGRLATQITAKRVSGQSDVTLAAYTYTYNATGNELTANSTVTSDPTNGVRTYAYDTLSRLTAAATPTPVLTSHTNWDIWMQYLFGK